MAANTTVVLKDVLSNVLIEYSVLLRQFFGTLHDGHKREAGSSSKDGLESIYISIVEKDKMLQQFVDYCM